MIVQTSGSLPQEENEDLCFVNHQPNAFQSLSIPISDVFSSANVPSSSSRAIPTSRSQSDHGTQNTSHLNEHSRAHDIENLGAPPQSHARSHSDTRKWGINRGLGNVLRNFC